MSTLAAIKELEQERSEKNTYRFLLIICNYDIDTVVDDKLFVLHYKLKLITY